MDSESDLNKSEKFDDNYDDNHDSDIESRLYAEIYFSNSIIGEEKNSVDSATENELFKNSDKTTDNSIHTCSDKNKDQLTDIQTNNDKKESDNLARACESEPSQVLDFGSEIDSDKQSPGITQDRSTSSECNNTSNSQKRSMTSNEQSDQPNKKKRKYHNKNSTEIQQDTSTIIVENEENCSSDASDIIELSSETSKDSIENNSKYNTIHAADKKLQNKKSRIESSDSESSDSGESIFEVPVPPKPKPPLIELNDSDSERNVDNDVASHKSSKINVIEEIELLDSRCNAQNIDSESIEDDDIILNFSPIEKRISNLEQIKKLSHTSVRKSIESSSNVQREDNSLHNEDVCIIEDQQSKLNNKVTKTPLSKQKNKSTSNRRNISLNEYFFQPMTDKMKSFYNESWGGENFDMDEMKSKMSNDPNKWAILDDDLGSSFAKRKRYFGVVCNRCQKEGHRHNQCPEPFKKPVCFMCGVQGHFEHSCPKRICLTCGKKQNSYRKTCDYCQNLICSRCHSRGHLENSCPDLWRRYHQTINNVDVVPSNSEKFMKSQYQRFCCNCAKRGHDSAVCRKLRWSQHFPLPSHVTNYSGPSYSTENSNTSRNLDDTLGSSFDFDDTRNNSSLDRSNITNESDDHYYTVYNLFNLKSKSYRELPSFRNIVLKVKVSEVDDLKFRNWKILYRFLKQMVEFDDTLQLVLERRNGKLQMILRGNKVISEAVIKLVQQYASRNNFERSKMLFKFERDIVKLKNQLTQKFLEAEALTDNPRELYKDIKQLREELGDELLKCEPRKFPKIHRYALCLEKLCMILFVKLGLELKESIKILKIFRTKLDKSFCEKSRDNYSPPIKMRFLIRYIYHYNNIFAPHEPDNLSKYMQLYEDHVGRCNRLMNNPLLFPPNQNATTCEQPHKNSTQNQETSTAVLLGNYPTSSTTFQLPPVEANTSLRSETSTVLSTSSPIKPQVLPLLSINTSITTQTPPLLSINTSITSNLPISQEHSYSTEKNFSKRKMNPLYLTFLNCKSYKKNKFKVRFDNFIKDTRDLVAKAIELNEPSLQKHIRNVSKKLKNEIYLSERDVKKFRQLVKEVKRRREKAR